MILAFLAGAYIREPIWFTRKEKEVVQPQTQEDIELTRWFEEEAKREQQRQIQMYNIMNWHGEKGQNLKDGN